RLLIFLVDINRLLFWFLDLLLGLFRRRFLLFFRNYFFRLERNLFFMILRWFLFRLLFDLFFGLGLLRFFFLFAHVLRGRERSFLIVLRCLSAAADGLAPFYRNRVNRDLLRTLKVHSTEKDIEPHEPVNCERNTDPDEIVVFIHHGQSFHFFLLLLSGWA